MRCEGWWRAGVVGVGLLAAMGPGLGGEVKARKAGGPGRCIRAVMEGEVRAGQGFRRSFGGGLELRLEPVASGWVVRVLPERGDRPREDYAEIATPPYRSVSPLLVSTDFSFRAQDAVGWNPRRFRYARDARAFGAIEAVYRQVTGTTGVGAAGAGAAGTEAVGGAGASDTGAAGAEARLAELVGAQPEGVLEIVDASLAPGTGDQTRAAGLVSSHFGAAAHRIEQPEGGRATALGRIGWMRFRVKLDLLRGLRPANGVAEENFPCGTR